MSINVRWIDFCLQCQKFIGIGGSQHHLDMYPDHHLVETYVTEDHYDQVMNNGMLSSKVHFTDEHGNAFHFGMMGDTSYVASDKDPENCITLGNRRISYVFENNGLATKSKYWHTRSTILFPGIKAFGVLRKIKVIISVMKKKQISSIRIFDVTNNKEICVGSCEEMGKNLIILEKIANIPESEAIWEIQLKTNKYATYCNFISLEL